MPSKAEIWQALYGAWRLAHLDRNAIRYFDLSHHGTWRSFWAPVFCYPAFLLEIWLRLSTETVAHSGLGHIFLVESIGYVVGWTAFPLAVLALCRWLGHEERGFDFITVYNWSYILQTGFFVAVTLVCLVLPNDMALALLRAAVVATLVYEWFIALVAIGAGGWIAGLVVVLDIALGLFIQLTTLSLY